jgi:hypothetical protein
MMGALADKIRVAEHGLEVRETIAQGIEYAENWQTVVEANDERIDNIIAHGTEGSLEEVVDVRTDNTGYVHASAGAHVRAIDSDLAGKVNYRQQAGPAGAETYINMIAGYEGNAIASDIRAATISGGGVAGFENIIGGRTANVGTTTPNVADVLGTGASYAVIGGGYDNVNNALAGVLTGFHCVIEQLATHATISGGSYHKILDGDYGTIGGGTQNTINDGANASISGGSGNKITGNNTTIGGGYNNEVKVEGGTIAGGTTNIVNNSKGTIGGGSINTVSADNGTIAGGLQNTISAGLYGCIGGGYKNTVSANYGVIGGGFTNNANASAATVCGGNTNVASGIYSTVIGGANGTASGQGATVLGGELNQATADHSTASGKEAKAAMKGQFARAAGKFTNAGDAQSSENVLRIITTDATAALIGIEGAALAPVMPASTSWFFTARIVARRTDVEGDTACFEVKGLAYRNVTGNITLVGTPTITQLFATAGATTWAVSVVLGTSTLNIKATGEAGKTIRWVEKLELVEVSC